MADHSLRSFSAIVCLDRYSLLENFRTLWEILARRWVHPGVCAYVARNLGGEFCLDGTLTNLVYSRVTKWAVIGQHEDVELRGGCHTAADRIT